MARAANAPAPGPEGTWQGLLAGKLHLIVMLAKSNGGGYEGYLNSVDQNATVPIDHVRVDGSSVHFEVSKVKGAFDGKLSADGATLSGQWTQGGAPQTLELQRHAPEAAKTSAPTAPPLAIPLDVSVPAPPIPFQADGKTHLVYELHLVNVGGAECVLTGVDVLANDSSERTLASLSPMDLEVALGRPGQPKLTEKSHIGAGSSAVLYLWVSLDKGAGVPSSLRHRIRAKYGSLAGELSLEGIPVTVNASPVRVLQPPLTGQHWVAVNGPSNTSIHRRALISTGGQTRISQRYAIDWLQFFPDSQVFHGDPKDNHSFKCYGAEIHSVADGVVTEVKDGIPENTPGDSRAVPITLETIAGNHVIVDIGSGQFAFYAHMQPGSVRVKLGDKVRAGQVLGLVGNTGNASAPHLHFHLSTGSSPLGSEGLPYSFASFDLEGRGGKWNRDAAPVKREGELPVEMDIVGFPEGK
jgi:hypothetical protein